MSITRNRELSQFGSFIHIDDNTQSIGITTNSVPFVGIGTTNPSVKFEVIGNTNVSGTINATSFTLNGSPLINAAIEQWKFATNNTDIYRLEGNIGIGTSQSLTQKLNVIGNISAGQFISTVTSGTAPLVVLSDTQVTNLNASFLRGKISPNGDIVGTSDNQILTNKTLTSPSLTTPAIGSGGATFNGTSGSTNLRASASASGTLTLPAVTDTLVGRGTTDTLINKTIAVESNTITGITSSNLSASAGILNTQLANPTISGVSLGGNLNSLTFGTYLSSTGVYNGSTARTVSVAGTSINTANTLVARDISGDFTAGTISVTNLTASQTVTALDFNSTSDIKFKENVKTIENSLDIVSSLRGVSFNWKETGNGSYGVIAQELEQVLPDLVKNGEFKTVNYDGIIGVLIESIKELSNRISELENNTK